MNNLDIPREIIKETLKGTGLPVSIKIRAKVGNVTAYKFVKKLSDLPISAIMIHGRSLKQGFAGEINYEQIRKVKELVDIPVLANGGINSPEDAKRMLQRTGADGLGIARGALTKPWIFSQIKDYLEKGEYQEFELDQIKKSAIHHAEMSYKSEGKHGIIQMRKYLIWYFRGFENAKELRKELVKVESMGDIKRVLKEI